MKKAIIFITAMILVGCTCIGQIPPQTLYIDQSCQALLPDYTERVIVRDNCPGVTVEQTPEPGTILDQAQPAITVTIMAMDSWGNTTSTDFEVVAVDTIFPTIEPDSTLLTHKVEDIGTLIKSAHLATKRYYINTYEYITPDSIKHLFNPDDWNTHGMFFVCPPGGVGDYAGLLWKGATYACPCDTSEAARFVAVNLPL
jgi:hypothetical protein